MLNAERLFFAFNSPPKWKRYTCSKNWWFRIRILPCERKHTNLPLLPMWLTACLSTFSTHQYLPFGLGNCCIRLKGNQEQEEMGGNYDATRSGVSASTDSKAVCTLSNQLSSRSRKDLICGIPRTLGCTQETCTVPSTWSIIPSIRWTYCQNHSISFAP